MKTTIKQLKTLINEVLVNEMFFTNPEHQKNLALLRQIGRAVADSAINALIEEVRDSGGKELDTLTSEKFQNDVAKLVRVALHDHFYTPPDVD